jgi:hypothetical protein
VRPLGRRWRYGRLVKDFHTPVFPSSKKRGAAVALIRVEGRSLADYDRANCLV